MKSGTRAFLVGALGLIAGSPDMGALEARTAIQQSRRFGGGRPSKAQRWKARRRQGGRK
jgi:hypothetical protein